MIFSLVYIFYCPIKSWNPYEWICERIVRVFFLWEWIASTAHRRLKWSWWAESPKVIHHAGDDAEPAVCAVVKPPASESASNLFLRHWFHSSESAVVGNFAHHVWYWQKQEAQVDNVPQAAGGGCQRGPKEATLVSVFQFIRRLRQPLRRFIHLSVSVCAWCFSSRTAEANLGMVLELQSCFQHWLQVSFCLLLSVILAKCCCVVFIVHP